MYETFYGLEARPFQLTPDARFWFDTVTHKKAMAYLGYGLAQGEGFIVITGEIGAGKTTLVGHLMETIDRERLLAITIVSSQIEPDDLLRLVAQGQGTDTAGLTKAQLLAAIEKGLHATARGGRRTLLIVDEAQALPAAALEELRMLSNFQASGHALLQIFLLGQPEFRDLLQGAGRLEQLRQRVIAMHHLEPMGPEEVEPYMHHRLLLTGWKGRPHFTAEAFAALHAGSGGVPRVLNNLAGRVLLYGAIEQIEMIDAEVVELVIADADAETNAARRAEAKALPPIELDQVSIATAPPAAAEPVPPPVTPAIATDPELIARVAALEARVEEQDAALRRVLTLLVDWVESGRRPDISTLPKAN